MGLKESKFGRRVVHLLLVIYAVILAYVVLGLILRYQVSADIFFGLSFALLFFALGQSVYEMGIKNTLILLAISTIIGFLAEVLGTSTGFPFGKYYYTDFLGQKVLNVPIVVPLVWFVIAYITFSQCFSYFGDLKNPRESGTRILSLVALAAFGTMAWDLMVDPMFVSYGYWVWEGTDSIPTLYGVPLSNFVGWFVVAFLMMGAFLYVTRKKKVIQRHNLLDSRIVYLMLLVDGSVANWSLSQYAVIVIGAVAMLAFVCASYFLIKREKRRIKTESSVSQKI